MNTDLARSMVESCLGEGVRAVTPLQGSSWTQIWSVQLDSSASVVAKVGALGVMEEERAGLLALRETRTVRIPDEVGWSAVEDQGILVLEFLQSGGPPDWVAFADQLADLHSIDVWNRFGFAIDNHLGGTDQCNAWHDDWASFNRDCRHGPLLRSVSLRADDRGLVQQAIDSFDGFMDQVRPSLIHGDLWSGNALPLVGGRVGLIDPAPSFSDRLADIAMMQMFGGFPEAFFDAYFSRFDSVVDPRRLAACRLYHALNHLHLFGGGYAGLVRQEATAVLAADS